MAGADVYSHGGQELKSHSRDQTFNYIDLLGLRNNNFYEMRQLYTHQPSLVTCYNKYFRLLRYYCYFLEKDSNDDEGSMFISQLFKLGVKYREAWYECHTDSIRNDISQKQDRHGQLPCAAEYSRGYRSAYRLFQSAIMMICQLTNYSLFLLWTPIKLEYWLIRQ